MYKVSIERDSVSPAGDRLTTFIITYPRVVLAEAVTHRRNQDGVWGESSVFERAMTQDVSKSSASSRAIPLAKMIDAVKDDPYTPDFTANRKGMQGDPLDADRAEKARHVWRQALLYMTQCADVLQELGVHKQDANRLLEPFAWVTQVVTSSRWDNFFALRCHGAAHPALRKVARMMFLARRNSSPTLLRFGQWHLPFVPPEQAMELDYKPVPGESLVNAPDLIKFSAARCAWVSYCNHEQDGSIEKMLNTFNLLVGSVPRHAGPTEHQATPMHPYMERVRRFQSNLTGWLQARKLLDDEEVTRYEPTEAEIDAWGE